MKCERFRTTISESAAAGDSAALAHDTVLSGNAALQEHLDGCVSCREFHANEQNLFAAIDDELSRAANADVSASFLPRVRSAIELEGSAGSAAHSWFVLWPAAAAMIAVCLLVVILQRIHLRPQTPSQATARATATSPANATISATSTTSTTSSATSANSGVNSATSAATQPASSEVASETQVLPRRTPQQETSHDLRKVAHDVRMPRSASRFVASAPNQGPGPQELEVLVPPDERIALAKFMARLPQRREMAIALTKQAAAAPTSDVISGPLEIAELKVEPLSPAEAK